MSDTNMEKLAKIARQAMNIQIMEAEFCAVNSDDEPVTGTKNVKVIVYNLENISAEEVEEKMRNGTYEFDSRILITDPDTIKHIFPHRGESKRTGSVGAYWKHMGDKNDYIHCTCSDCGYMTEALRAVEIGRESTNYTGVKWRFCPNCGAPMSHTNQSEAIPKDKAPDLVIWKR